MAKAKVFQAIFGLVKNTNAWGGAAIAVGATHGMKILSSPLQPNTALIENMSIQGRATQMAADPGVITIQGDVFNAELAYEGFERSIAGVMGTAGAPATVDTSAKLHKFRIKDSLDGIFWTIAYELIKDTTIWEYNTVKLTGLTLRGTQGGRVEITVRGIAHSWTDASIINTTTTIDTVTVPAAAANAVLFAHLVARMNDASSGALGASDVRYISAFEINIDRNLQVDITTEFGNKTSEPQPPTSGDPFTKVSGSITFSQLDTASPGGSSGLPAKQIAGTQQKMDLVLTSPVLAGAATEKFSIKMYLPSLQMGDGKPAMGSLGWTVPFTAKHVGTAPTGFDAADVDAITFWWTSTRTADALV